MEIRDWSNPVLFETPRLIIRPLTVNDADDAHALFGIFEVMQPVGLLPVITSLEATKERLMRWEADGFHHAIVLRNTQQVIGYIALNPDSEEARADTRELGYALHPDYWHQGYMSETIKATLKELHTSGIRYVWACCFQENTTSKVVIERCGFAFRQTGEFLAAGEGKTYATYEYCMDLRD